VKLRNHYEVDKGTSDLTLPAQSREEIFTDKMTALALRRAWFKGRDLCVCKLCSSAS